MYFFFFFSSRRRHTRSLCDWSSDVCSSDLECFGAPTRTDSSCLQVQKIEQESFSGTTDYRDDRRPAEGGGFHPAAITRSEERRVGKEGRSGGGRWYTEEGDECIIYGTMVR